ncbi:CopD family protein [uncultured Sphingomonas sp.]|uniref:CopD family protein n=1 Tax=uncultured Sphingomonas sp. TaxID=158754 RepID=UPI00260BFD84|nr:CopD family protein [uncultured Sphingomonas sp.]
MIDYRALLALHLIAVPLFVSGVLVTALILPSLAAGEETPRRQAERHRVRRWNLILTTPAMLVVWVVGLTLAAEGGWFAAGWLHAKIALVVLLTGLHGMQSGRLRRLDRVGGVTRAPVWPVPAILLLAVAIVALAIIKP